MDFLELLKASWPVMVVGGGWIISVERRLTQLGSVKETVEKVDEKIDKLVDRLLDD